MRFLQWLRHDVPARPASDRSPAGTVLPPPAPPATSIAQAVARMESIDALLPRGDGLACFNRMYLGVTKDVSERVDRGAFDDPTFISHLDVVFANIYFAAVDALSGPASKIPAAWQPLIANRSNPRIEPIQFALAGMNAHINHDLPLAVVRTCRELSTAPDTGTHHVDYQRVDALLDAAEQSVRESFEPRDVEVVDRHAAAVMNVVCNWTMNAARDVAWRMALALWEVRDHADASALLSDSLARTVAMASRGLLAVV